MYNDSDNWHVRLISPLSRITLAVFVVKTGAQHCQRGPAAEVLTGYQLQPRHLEHERVVRSLWRDNWTWQIGKMYLCVTDCRVWWIFSPIPCKTMVMQHLSTCLIIKDYCRFRRNRWIICDHKVLVRKCRERMCASLPSPPSCDLAILKQKRR